MIIIFDMDGTLLDSSIDITISINFVREKQALPPLSIKRVCDIINSNEENIPISLYGKKEATKERKMFKEHFFSQCTQNVKLYEGILPLLENLKQKNAKLSIATNATTIFAEKMVNHLGIAKYFDFIIGKCKVKNSKPSPEMIHKILNNYTSYNKAYMIGDSHKDILSAQNANITPLFANWGFGEIREYKEVESFNSPDELVEFFEK